MRCLQLVFDGLDAVAKLCVPAQQDAVVMDLVRHLYKVLGRQPERRDYFVALTRWHDRSFSADKAFACHRGLEVKSLPLSQAPEISGAIITCKPYLDDDARMVSDSNLDLAPLDRTPRQTKRRRIRRALCCW